MIGGVNSLTSQIKIKNKEINVNVCMSAPLKFGRYVLLAWVGGISNGQIVKVLNSRKNGFYHYMRIY